METSKNNIKLKESFLTAGYLAHEDDQGEHLLWERELGEFIHLKITTETGSLCFYRPLFHVYLEYNDPDMRADRYCAAKISTTSTSEAVAATQMLSQVFASKQHRSFRLT